MFTGLVEETGEVTRIEERANGRRLWIGAGRVREDAGIGDSIAVSGCCLTVVALEPGGFGVEVVPETMRRTTLGRLVASSRVNLERSLRLDQRLGGHLVQGHVDGVGAVLSSDPEGEGRWLALEIPADLRRFVAEKGSIAVDGMSLTVAKAEGGRCEIALIPHTLEKTTAKEYRAGSAVNLEVDLVARYLARLVEEAGGVGRRP